MLGMKTDMSGAAIVLAVLSACRELEVPVRVTGLLAIAENAVGGGSYRPGDVITHYGGRTVEIGNTDAEGRIVMADALAYADAHLDPDLARRRRHADRRGPDRARPRRWPRSSPRTPASPTRCRRRRDDW